MQSKEEQSKNSNILWHIFKGLSSIASIKNGFKIDTYCLRILYVFPTINDTETLHFLENAVVNVCLLNIRILIRLFLFPLSKEAAVRYSTLPSLL